jgi:hypothetical protein
VTSKFIVMAHLSSHVAVGVKGKFILMAQRASVAAVGFTFKFILRAHRASDLAVGVTSNFFHTYEVLYIMYRMIPTSSYKQSSTSTKFRR